MASNSKDKKSNKRPKLGDDFESVAKRLGCDDDKDRFEAKLGKIAKAKPTAAIRNTTK
jgi:hypothetical protein